MGKVVEMFAELGFKFEKTTLGDFINSVKELDMSVIASAAGVGGLYMAMKNITGEAVDFATVLHNFTVETGIPEEEIQRWMKLSAAQHISKDAILGVVKALESKGFFPEQVIPMLKTMHDTIKGWNPMAQAEYLKKYGAESLQVVLAMKDMNEQLARVSVVGKSGVGTLYALGNKARALEGDFSTGFNKFAITYAPALDHILDDIEAIGKSGAMQFMMDKVLKTTDAVLFGWGQIFQLVDAMGQDYGKGGPFDTRKVAEPWKPEYKKWASNDFQNAINEGIAARAAGQTTNHINITVHGMAEGPMSIANAIKEELKHIFRGTETQHANNGH